MKIIMIKWYIGVLLLIAGVSDAFAIKAYFDYKVFYDPASGPYAEFILSFDGASMKYRPLSDSTHKAEAEVTLIVSQHNKVIDFRKVTADGPVLPIGLTSDFMALERMRLADGDYDLEIKLTDLANPETPEIHRQKISINHLSEGLFLSDIELINAYSPTEEANAFSKSGFDVIPSVSNHYGDGHNVLLLYVEVYNADKYFGTDSAFVVVSSIESLTGSSVDGIMKIKRDKGKPVCPEFHTLDISSLGSGDYRLRVEVRDRNNSAVLSRYIPITRTQFAPATVTPDMLAVSFAGKYTDRDSLLAIVESMQPIANPGERSTIQNVIPSAELIELQGFFYSFWQNRNSSQPEAAWRAYEKELKAADAAFGNKVKKGWQTDRGRVYLQYGPPNTRVERPHPTDYWPFEIWHYYESGKGRNLKFLFYNPSLSGDFELLHADAPGEIFNASWREMVRSGFRNDPIQTGRNTFNQRDSYSGDELEELWFNPH
ncbi:MAG: GWxTD domain-containing protein [Flavobacteriales bacterium]|nr:GWxTD domain-containing protein [Flavobacteriales bacterium]